MEKGFTLIEIIIYIGILGIVIFLVTGFIFNGITGTGRIEAWQDVNDSGRFLTSKITEAIESAQGVNAVQ